LLIVSSAANCCQYLFVVVVVFSMRERVPQDSLIRVAILR
jgi:hypothetical protein